MIPRTVMRAPVRLDFAGGWTDVPPFAEREGGAVVNATIDLPVEVVLEGRGSGITLEARDLGRSLSVARREELTGRGDLALLTAAVLRWPLSGGLSLTTSAAAPVGSGLGTSGALDVALAAAFTRATGLDPTPAELAELGYHLEAVDVGLAGGRQDQYAAALGGINLLHFRGATVEVARLEISSALAAELERRLVVCYLGESRVSGKAIARVMNAYRQGVSTVVDALRAMRSLAGVVADALMAGDLPTVGAVLSDNWRCQQALDEGMCTPAMARLDQAMRAAGVLGGKAAGAGAGGSMFFLTGDDPRAAHRAAESCGAIILPVLLTDRGVHAC